MTERSSVLLLLLAGLIAACSGQSASSTLSGPAGFRRDSAVNLTVYAAASLDAALPKVVSAYESSHRAVSLTISTGSSTALETQIEQGAPADVFLSADLANPQKLGAGGLAYGAVVAFAANQLTVIVPAANPAALVSPADLARSGVKVVAAGDAVPISEYAQALVENLGRQPGYPAGFVAKYEANVVSKEDNVAAVVTKIELGEGDAAIVYATDARSSAGVRTIEVPAAANVTATYGAVAVKASMHATAAQAFLAWLAGPDGQSVLASFGFLTP